MAQDMVNVMKQLGFARFSVAGHDRGGRVAYRMALDHPKRVDRIAVLDILPTATVWDRADARFALAYWPWSLLAQPEPLPERILAAAPEAIVDNALGGWGSPSAVFPPEVRAAYAEALRDPAHAHAICEEYRAAATLDREHDMADSVKGRRIALSAGHFSPEEAPEHTVEALNRFFATDSRRQANNLLQPTGQERPAAE